MDNPRGRTTKRQTVVKKQAVKVQLVKRVKTSLGTAQAGKRTRKLKKKRLDRLHLGLAIFFLLVLITGVFYLYFTKGNPMVLGVEEMVEMDVPQWYTQALVVSRGEQSLSVTPLAGSRVQVERKNNQYIYRDAYPNTDVVQTEYHYKIKEELIFKQPGHPIEFKYRLGNVKDYYIEEDEEGNIIFYDRELYEKQGGANDLSRVFTIPTPFIEDARKQRSFLAVEVIIESDLLMVSIDESWVKKARYPMTLDPTIEINVINVYSHPQQGETWEVSFTTQGRADLKIIPADQATIDDDEFVSLWCGNEQRQPQILADDVIFYPDWSCPSADKSAAEASEGIGKVVHYTKKAGKHTLKFDFGGQIAWAYNDPSDPWWDTNFSYRVEVPVYYSGSESLTEYQIMIDNFDTASLVTASKMRSDCGDIRFTATTTDLLSYTIVGNTCNTADTEIWVKTDILMNSATTTFYMYYGNAATTSADSIVDTFSYSEVKTVGYPLNPAVASMEVITLEANNTIVHNDATTTLTNVGDTTTISSLDDYGAVKATKLFNMSNNGYDVIAPVGWAGTEFIYRTRSHDYTEYFVLISPWGTASTSIYAAGVDCGTNPRTVTSSGLSVTDCAIAVSTQYRIVSDIPIVANKSNDVDDAFPMHPATADPWYGWDSTQSPMGAGPNGANYVKIDSNDTASSSSSLGANGGTDLAFDGTGYYGGQIGKVYATDYPIGITSNADGDGGDATTWVPRYEFGTKFGSAYQTDFVSVLSDQEAGCTTYTAAGASQDSATTTSSNTEVYKMPSSTFGMGDTNAYISGAWYVECDKPVYVVSQDTDDEQNMWSYPMMRQFTYPTPFVGTLGSEEEVGLTLTWNTGAADFEIWQSGSLSWDTGTLICSGTLTDDYGSTIDCSGGTIAKSTQYRMQVVLKNVGDTGVNMNGAGDFVDHKNVKAGWAGTSPTLGNCGFNDFGTDDSSTTCSAAYNGNDVRITNTGGGNVVIAATTGTEGFVYLITTDSDPATDSTSYMYTSIDSETQDSSKITITAAPDLQQLHYRWRYDNGGETDWLDSNWGYRKKVSLSGSSGAGANYQVKLIINYSSGGDFDCESNCDTDFDDIRFTDSNGTTTLDYWREDYTSSDTATFWIEVKDDLDSNQDVYVYYGNGSAETTSNATNTALFWDDFDGTSLDTTSRWDTTSGSPPATWSVHDGYLSMWDEWGSYCDGSGVYNRLNTQQSFTPPIAAESRFSVAGTDTIGNTNICYHTILGNRDVVGISGGSTYGNVFKINTSYTGITETFPAKDTWYRISKYYETDQLRAITSYGIDNTYSGSVISSGVIGLAGDTDADLEASMTDRVDWIFIRKYIDPEPDFSSVGNEESYPGSVNRATFILDEDTGLANMETASTTRLRFLVSNEGGQSTTTIYQLEYNKVADCSSAGYAVVPTDSSGAWKIEGSSYISNGGDVSANIVDQLWADALTDPVSSNTFTVGELRDDSNTTSDITLTDSQFTEIEFSLQAVDGNAEAGAQYCFRLTNSGDPTNFTYTKYATSTIVGVANTTPIITFVSVSPPFVKFGNMTINFFINWDDADSGEQVKVKICQTNSLTNQNCDNGWWASSTAFTTANPETVSTTTKESWEGWNDYWVFVCDDEDACSSPYHSSFYVGYTTEIDPTALGKMYVNSSITGYYTDGLVGQWTFNGQDMDWSSPTAEALDRSGNGNSGDVNGAKVTIGKVGQALEFNGSNNYVSINNHSSLQNLTGGITISVWIKPNSIAGDNKIIVEKYDGSVPVEFNLYTNDDDLRSYMTEICSYDDVISTSVWQHVIMTHDGTDITLFHNGVKGTSCKQSYSSASGNLAIGIRPSDGSSFPYNGLIDEVCIYNYVLATSTIEALYQTGARKARF